MSQQATFLTAIRENPEDDTARLAYADWFSERGQPGDAEYAELIRLQCTLARVPSDDVPAEPLLRRETELLDLFGPTLRANVEAVPGVKVDWNVTGLPDLIRSARDSIPDVRVMGCLDRGFVASAVVDLNRWEGAIAERMKELFANGPIRSLRLEGHFHERLRAFLDCPELTCVSRLYLGTYAFRSQQISAEGIWLVASCPHLCNLSSLNLGYRPVNGRLVGRGNLRVFFTWKETLDGRA